MNRYTLACAFGAIAGNNWAITGNPTLAFVLIFLVFIEPVVDKWSKK